MADVQVTPAIKKCANCGKPASKICAGCNDAPDLKGAKLPSTVYCTYECQIANRAEHKNQCNTLKMRRSLFRAADIIQQALLNFRQHNFDRKLRGIEKDGSSTVILAEPASTKVIGNEVDASVLADPNDRSAVLTASYCAQAMAYTVNLIKQAVTDIATTIEELGCVLHNHRREVVYSDVKDNVSPEEFRHDVFFVVLKSGEQYIMDFTGHQYGFHRSVLPLSDFLSFRLQDRRELGYTKLMKIVYLQQFVSSSNHTKTCLLTQFLDYHYGGAMDMAVFTWDSNPGRKELSEILKLPEEVYQAERDEFLQHLRGSLVRCRNNLVERGLIKYKSCGSTLATKNSWKLIDEMPLRDVKLT